MQRPATNAAIQTTIVACHHVSPAQTMLDPSDLKRYKQNLVCEHEETYQLPNPIPNQKRQKLYHCQFTI